MKYELTQMFDCDLASFEKALFAEKLLPILQRRLDGVGAVETLSSEDDGRWVKRSVKYVPNKTPAFARKLKPEQLTWIEESTYDRRERRGEYRMLRPRVPTKLQEKFDSIGTFTLTEMGGKVRRVISGAVTVRVRFLGMVAERFVVGDLKKTFEGEAESVRELVRELQGGAA